MPRSIVSVRRRLLCALAGTAVLLVTATGCAADAASTPGGPSESGVGDVTMQLSWVFNKSFAGEYFADSEGYYADAGISPMQLVPGPSTGIAELLAGSVDFAITDLYPVAAAIANEGAPVKILAATFQKNPLTVISLADGADIRTPEDLIGKKIGVQSVNQSTFDALLATNGIDSDQVAVVPVEYDPSVLTVGEVDGYIGYATDQSASLETQGFDVVDLLFADNGLPFIAGAIVTTDQIIEEQPELVKALLEAEARGWSDAVADPEAGAALAVDVYGVDLGLDMANETAGAILQTTFVSTDETIQNGLLTVSDELQFQTVESLGKLGISIERGDLFDLELLGAMYDENPELR